MKPAHRRSDPRRTNRRRWARILPGTCAALWFASTGCRPAEDPWIELGTGQLTWEELGADIELVYGSQGGWHVDVALRSGGWDADGIELSYRALDAETDELISFETTALLDEDRVLPIDGGWERVGDRVVFDVLSDAEVLGRTVRLVVDATDGDAALEDAGTVTIVGPAR
jgi:hypothetical protein